MGRSATEKKNVAAMVSTMIKCSWLIFIDKTLLIMQLLSTQT